MVPSQLDGAEFDMGDGMKQSCFAFIAGQLTFRQFAGIDQNRLIWELGRFRGQGRVGVSFKIQFTLLMALPGMMGQAEFGFNIGGG